MIDPQTLMQYLTQIHQKNGQVDNLPGFPAAPSPVQMQPSQGGGIPIRSVLNIGQAAMAPGGMQGMFDAGKAGGLAGVNNFATANAADSTAANFAAPAASGGGLSGILSLLSGFL